MLDIAFWGVIDVPRNKVINIITEIAYPHKSAHNHSLDVFSISASDTYPKLKAFIQKCVNNGMGHHNTFIQVGKYARETLVPEIEQEIGKKIRSNDTRFFPTRRTVYTYWMCCSGGSVRAREDQGKIQELIDDIRKDDTLESNFSITFEAFDPRILAQ